MQSTRIGMPPLIRGKIRSRACEAYRAGGSDHLQSVICRPQARRISWTTAARGDVHEVSLSTLAIRAPQYVRSERSTARLQEIPPRRIPQDLNR